MSDINFIRENPGIAAFQQGTRHAQDLMSQDLLNDARMQQIVEGRAAMPSRLRTVEASADMARTQADVAAATAGFDITREREAAAQAPIQTQAAIRSEGEMAATSDDRVAQSGQRTRLGEVGVQNAELEGTYKVFDLLAAGDTQGAMHVAKQLGVDLPEAVIGNKQLIQQLKALGDQARSLYPNSPRRQQMFMEEGTKGLVEGTKANANRADPAYPFRVENAPEPDMTASGTGKRLQFEVVQEAALQMGYSPEDAFAIASGRKPPTDMEMMELARKLTAMEMPSSDFRTSPEQRRQRYDEILGELKSQNAARVAPDGQAPAPAPGGGAALQGQGTQADPYQATTQDEVDWFKNSAPAGSVIMIDGQLYTK